MGDDGLELYQQSTGKSKYSEMGAAESGAVGAPAAFDDADLQAVVDAWPKLPKVVKAGISAMAKAADDEGAHG